jgi:hypothetical protein
VEAIDVLEQKVDLVQKQVENVQKEVDLMSKSVGLEFEKISKAFAQMGNLLDLLYLETSVLIEMLAKKEVINQEEFTKTLEETAKKVEEQIKAAQDKREEKPIIEKI